MPSNQNIFWKALVIVAALLLILGGAIFFYNNNSFSRAGELTAGADELYSGAAGAEPRLVPGQVLVKFKSLPAGAGARTAVALSPGVLGLEKSLPAGVQVKTVNPIFSVLAADMKAAPLPARLCLLETGPRSMPEPGADIIPTPSVIPVETGIQSVDSPIEPEDGGDTSYPRDTTYPDIESESAPEPVIMPTDESAFGAQVLSAIPAKSSRCYSFTEALASAGGEELKKSAQQLKQRREAEQQRLNRAQKLEKQFGFDRWYVLDLSLSKQDEIFGVVRQLSQNSNVESAGPNYIARALVMTPNDPFFSSSGSWGQSYDDLWGIKKIRADQAWDGNELTTQGEGVVVAVVDSGVDYNHPDLAANMWINEGDPVGDIPDQCDRTNYPNIALADDDCNGYVDDWQGWDFAYGDNDPQDNYGHGSHVAGTIAAVANNSIGVVGVAPRVKIMPVKGLGDDGGGSYSALADAVRYAAVNGVKVINNSWGGPPHQIITDAFDYAYGLGVVSIAAAGNGNNDAFKYTPANLPTTITVAASTETDKRAGFSSYGNAVDVAAPGGGDTSGCVDGGCNILSTMPDDSLLARNNLPLKVGNGFWRIRGTSMASPHVAGAAALVLAQHPNFTHEEVRSVLKATSDSFPVRQDNYIGQGRINVLSATAVSAPLPIGWLKKIDTATVGSSVSIEGFAKGNNFTKYELYYGDGENPASWTRFLEPITEPVDGDYDNPGVLGSLNVPASVSGSFTVRLVVTSTALTGGRNVNYQTTFTPTCFVKQSIAPPVAPSSLQRFFNLADVDSDGDKDIVSIKSGRLSWYENGGGQNFVEHVIDDSVNPPPGALDNSHIYSVDLDKDGNLDVLVAHFYGIDWYKNDGNQNFTKQRIITRFAAKLVFAADMDKDGDTDVISFYRPSNAPFSKKAIVWLENDGSQVFTERVIDTLETRIFYFRESDIAVGDLGNDGDMDIVLGSAVDRLTTGEVGSLWLYENNGGQSFVRRNIDTRDEHGTIEIHSVELADVNKDGLLDIVTSSTGAGSELASTVVSWFAAPDFSKNVVDADITATTGNSARAANLDGDGDIDVAAVFKRDLPSDGIRSVNFYENDGRQRFVKHQVEDLLPANDHVSDLRVMDMDGDGVNDLLAVSLRNGIVWYKNVCAVPPPNNPPAFFVPPTAPHPLPIFTVGQNSTFTLKGTDPDGDVLTYSATALPVGSTLNAATGVFSWTPTSSQAGDHNVTFSISDGRGGSDDETITISVQAVAGALFEDDFNRADSGTLGDSWQNLSGNSGIENNKAVAKKFGAFAVVKNLSAADVKVSADVDLLQSFSIAGLIIRQSDSMSNWYLGWLTRSGNFMDFKIAKRFNGAFSMVARQWFPLADVSTAGKLSLGINGGALTMSFGGKTLTANDNNPLPAGSVGMYSVRLYGPANSTFDNFRAESVGEPLPNNPPVLSSIGNKTVTAGNNLSFTVSATDLDGDVLTYSATGLPTGATFTPATRTFSWTPTSSQTGDHSVTFTVSDGRGGSDSETITISVSQAGTTLPFVDDFNRPNSPDLGANWQPRRDSISIKDNKAVGSFGFPAATVSQLSVTNVTASVEVNVSQLEGLEEVGLIARCRENSGNCSNYYFGRIKKPTIGPPTIAIYKSVNFSSSAITNEVVVPVTTGTLSFQVNGNALILSFGGTTLTATDSSHPNAGYVGVKMRSHGTTDLTVDDFRAE